MATTPNASPSTANVTGTGTIATTSTINLTANSTADLAAVKSAITQATGNAPANTLAVGSTTSITQTTPGGKFVQGSTTTPILNAAVSNTPPATNTGTSSIFSVQNILGAAALATGGLAIYKAVSGGTNLFQSLVNNSNAVTPTSSTNNVQDPAQRAQAAAAIPSTGSTNNVQDPAQRQQAAEQAATTVVTPNTNSTNNVQDPAQRAQVADQTAIDNAKNVSTLQDPSQRQQAAITNADATSPTPVSTFSDPAQRQQALLPEPNTNSTNNVSDPASRAQANQIAIVNADNTSPTPVSTFSDPAQRAQAADQVAIDQAAATNNVSDPASRAQANQVLIENADATAPAQVSTLQDPAQRAQVADQIAIDKAQNISTLQDPAQRQQAAEQVIQDKKQADLNNEFAGVDEQVAQQKNINENTTGLAVVAEDGTVNPNIKINPETGELYVPAGDPAVDEFAGIDEQVAEQKIINENTTGQAVVAEDGTVNPNIKVNPETGELYVPVGDAAIDDQIRQQAEERIENKDARVISDEEAASAIQASKEETVNPGPKEVTDPAIKRVEDAAAEDRIAADEAAQRADAQTTQQGLTTAKTNTQSQATQQDVSNFQAKPDWRVRLSLSPGAQSAKYLYWADPPGILAPLRATDGVIFPYTPNISVAYSAQYDPTSLTHSNYKFYTYQGSSVDTITIGCEFTSQDTSEANYVLAVIHFFRSVTKMFYGQDQTPSNGTPPPLCYLSGLGAFQFDAHPLAITGFTYTLPTDVDYIKAGSTPTPAGVNKQNSPAVPKSDSSGVFSAVIPRLGVLNPGATASPPSWQTTDTGSKEATYVPTKINLSITAVPIITRNDISNNFSLKKYATGALLRGTKRAGGGIW